MGKNVHIQLDDEQAEWLEAEKDRLGLTWKGVLLHGWDTAESEG